MITLVLEPSIDYTVIVQTTLGGDQASTGVTKPEVHAEYFGSSRKTD